MNARARNTVCLWFDGDAEEAARFYASVFPDSAVTAVYRAPGDYPAGKQGDVLTVEFTVLGMPCLGLNGGPGDPHTDAFSFQVATADGAELPQGPDRHPGADLARHRDHPAALRLRDHRGQQQDCQNARNRQESVAFQDQTVHW